jgi:predicted DNA-binding transcriptional regulator AlpA
MTLLDIYRESRFAFEEHRMPKLVSPLWADTKTACAITGFCRQRLHELQKTSGFPQPIKIGRSSRYAVDAITDWMRQMSTDSFPVSTPLIAVEENARTSKPEKTTPASKQEPIAGNSTPLTFTVVLPKKSTAMAGIEISTRQVTRRIAPEVEAHTVKLSITKKVWYAPGMREAIEARKAAEKMRSDLLSQSKQIANTEDSIGLGEECNAVGTSTTPSYSLERMKHDYESGMTLD